MTNNSGTLYIGVTNDIARRLLEHRSGLVGGFTQRYKLTRLIYVESSADVRQAIQREKQLKGWTRQRKLDLIHSQNPTWRDLSEGWLDAPDKSESLTAEDQILRFTQNDARGVQSREVAPLRPERRGRHLTQDRSHD
jgi:putative endonuclease